MTGLLDTYLGCKPGYLPRTYVLKNYAENAKWSWSWACIINTDPTKWCFPRVSFLPKPESSYTETVSWSVVFIYSFQYICSFQYVLVHPINWSESSESCSAMSDSLWPHGLYSPWNSPGQNTGVSSLPLLQGNLPNPGIEPRSPALKANSLPAEPQGKPNNTGVGSLSLL